MSLLYGFKAWEQDDEGLLSSLYGKWPAGTYTAKCGRVRGWSSRRTQEGCSDPPSLDHSCGIYVYHDLDQAFSQSGLVDFEVDAVLGLLALWGRVYEHNLGLRGQHSQIVALWALHSHDALAERYNVEVLVDPFEFQRRCKWLLETDRRRDGVS